MIVTKLKDKKCKWCKEIFKPTYPLMVVCSIQCAIGKAKAKTEENKKKEQKQKDKATKENLKTKSDHLKDLQKVFNEYIRKRDEGKPCICCGKPLTKVYHAGHFFSVGAYPNLRFNEDNCHGQREDCNLHKHGNQAEYALRLPERIGEERFKSLLEKREYPLQATEFEIIEFKKYYRQKLKNYGK